MTPGVDVTALRDRIEHEERRRLQLPYEPYVSVRVSEARVLLDAYQQMQGRTERILCMKCGKSVSSPVPSPTVVRAWVVCPECLEGELSSAAEREQARAPSLDEGPFGGQRRLPPLPEVEARAPEEPEAPKKTFMQELYESI